MRLPEEKSRSRLPFILLLAGVLGVGAWGYMLAHETNVLWSGISHSAGEQVSISKTVEIGDRHFGVPTWELFQNQGTWQYVSAKKSLPAGYTPNELVSVGVAHGDTASDMQVARVVQSHLSEMFTAAQDNGVSLMVSSAYRSESDQQATYDTYLQRQGQAYVAQFVAAPLHSEHQTGLALDITGASAACAADSYQCSVTPGVVSWLEEHAAKYGFVQRYPSGKQSITGVAGEAWHYRFVGRPLAEALTTTKLTFDEFVQQAAPGYASSQPLGVD